MKTNNGLVTIIVPVYNTDPFLLEKCIQSIEEQEYQNIELIVVNDGSTAKNTNDYLAGINCDDITIIMTDNCGVSCARNKGLEKARGEYIYFLDSDDHISRNTIKELVEIMAKNDCVAAYGRKIRVTANTETSIYKYDEGEKDSDSVADEILRNTLYYASQGVLIRARKAKMIRFSSNIKYGEDFQYMFKLIAHEKIYLTNNCSYYYVENRDSALHKCSDSHINKYLDDFNDIYNEIVEIYPEEYNLLSLMMSEKINICLKKVYLHSGCSRSDYIKKAKSLKKYLISDSFTNSKMKLIQKTLSWLYYREKYALHYYLTRLICMIKKKAYEEYKN